MTPSSSSIFRDYFVPREVKLDDPVFIKRLQRLQNHLLQNYHIKEVHRGWQCTPKKDTELTPSILVTPETVTFVMKNLGF